MAAFKASWFLSGHDFRNRTHAQHGPNHIGVEGASKAIGFEVWGRCAEDVANLKIWSASDQKSWVYFGEGQVRTPALLTL